MPFRTNYGNTLRSMSMYSQLRPRSTRMDAARASFDLVTPRTMLGGFLSRQAAPDRDSGDMMSAQEANEMYPDIEEPFNSPVSRQFAAHANNRALHKRSLETVIQGAPDDMWQTVLNLGSSMGATMLDPVEFAVTTAAFATGVGALKMAGFARSTTGAARFAQAAAGNVAAAATVEPFIYNDAGYFQESRSVGEAFTSVAASAMVGTLFDFAFSKAGRALNDSGEADVMTSMALAEMGKEPTFALSRTVRNDIVAQGYGPARNNKQIGWDGAPRPEKGPDAPGPDQGPLGRGKKPSNSGFTMDDFPYSFRDVVDGGRGQRFYTVTRSPKTTIKGGRTPLMSTLLDEGVQLTDSPKNALSYAQSSQKQDGVVGALREVILETGNTVNADIPFKDATRSLRKLISSLSKDTPDMTLSQALREVKLKDSSKVQQNLFRIMDEEKIDGFYFKDTAEGQTFNNMFIKDPKKFVEQKTYTVKQKKSPKTNAKVQRFKEDLASPKSDYGYRENIATAADNTSPDFQARKNPELESEFNDVSTQYDGLKQSKTLSRSAKEVMEDADMLEKELNDIPEAIKDAFFCSKG